MSTRAARRFGIGGGIGTRHVDTPTSEDWRSRGAPLPDADSTALRQVQVMLMAESARLHDEAGRAGAGPEVLRESDRCAEAAATVARMIERRTARRSSGGVR